jgi:opacity protein-like surface antigen
LEYIKSRNGDTNLVPNIDIGDDFFSSRQIHLTPTLTLSVGNGIALRTGDEKFRIEHTLDVSLVKLWQTALFEIGVRRGITGSYGVSGPSYTTSFFSGFTIMFSRRLSAFAFSDFSLFDTDDEDFNTFTAGGGLRYGITSWLSAQLAYSYNWFDPKGNTSGSSFFRQEKTNSNNVFLSLSTAFDLWPNWGLARGGIASLLFPAVSPSGGTTP